MNANRKWTGQWIWHEALQEVATTNQMVLFRRRFRVEDAASHMQVHISADSRYRLFVNGERVGIGPCKGERFTQYYETYDITPHLRQGDNIIAVSVLHYAAGGQDGATGSGAIWRSPWGGLIVDGELTDEAGRRKVVLSTDDTWKCLHDRSYALVWESWISGKWLGGVERVDGELYPHDWHLPEYDDGTWAGASVIRGTISPWGVLNAWPLTPRPIPFLYETPKQFTRVVQTGGVVQEASARSLLSRDGALHLAPRASYWIELDAGELTTGYVRLALSGGGGSEVRLRCAECYETENAAGERVKDVRDRHTDGYKLVGDADHYRVAGYGHEERGRMETYEPFWFKTFRYVRLEIEVGDQPLQLHKLDYRETGYPLEVQADFACSDPSYTPLWDISIRTLRRCMHETYEDCPYYEQLQYLMDTALQMQFTYHLSGDDRLARRAIRDFHASRLPDGMIQCRYPSVGPQVIPGFALYWIGMLRNHYMYFGDLDLIRTYLPTAEGVLNWFRGRITEEGLVGPAPAEYWSYVDWVKGWENGIPPAGYDGPMTVYSFMFAAACGQFAELNRAVGRSDTASEYESLAGQVNRATKAVCWSEAQSLFKDGPHTDEYSQHAQLWSVLSGAVEGEEAADLMRRTMGRTDLAPVSYAMSFFLFRALSKADVYELTYPQLAPWHRMVDLNMTTWAESPAGNRSDCHAWGAVPLYEFPAEILGVKPDLPGFARVAVKPRIGHLTHAEGTVVTPQGLIHVRWELQRGQFNIRVDGPAGAAIRLRLPDGSEQDFPQGGTVEATCDYMHARRVDKR